MVSAILFMMFFQRFAIIVFCNVSGCTIDESAMRTYPVYIVAANSVMPIVIHSIAFFTIAVFIEGVFFEQIGVLSFRLAKFAYFAKTVCMVMFSVNPFGGHCIIFKIYYLVFFLDFLFCFLASFTSENGEMMNTIHITVHIEFAPIGFLYGIAPDKIENVRQKMIVLCIKAALARTVVRFVAFNRFVMPAAMKFNIEYLPACLFRGEPAYFVADAFFLFLPMNVDIIRIERKGAAHTFIGGDRFESMFPLMSALYANTILAINMITAQFAVFFCHKLKIGPWTRRKFYIRIGGQ